MIFVRLPGCLITDLSKIRFRLRFKFRVIFFGQWEELDIRRSVLQAQDVWLVGSWERLDLGSFPNDQRQKPTWGFRTKSTSCDRISFIIGVNFCWFNMEYLVVRLEAGHLDFLVPRTVNCDIDYLVVRLEADHLDFSCHNCELYHHLKLRMMRIIFVGIIWIISWYDLKQTTVFSRATNRELLSPPQVED